MSLRLIVDPVGRSRVATATGRGDPSEWARRCRAARSVATSAAVTAATRTAPSHRSTARGERRDMAEPLLERKRAGARREGEVGRGGSGERWGAERDYVE